MYEGLFCWLHEIYISEFIFFPCHSILLSSCYFIWIMHVQCVLGFTIIIIFHYSCSHWLYYFWKHLVNYACYQDTPLPPFILLISVNRYVLCVKYPHVWLCFKLLWLVFDLVNRIECMLYFIYLVVWINFDVLW